MFRKLFMFVTRLIRGLRRRMSGYDESLINSDLDAFKHEGVVRTAAVTLSGSLGAGARTTQTATLTIPNPDFSQFLFDNDQKHSGKFKNLSLEGITMVNETTSPSELTCGLNVSISGDQVVLSATLFNPYSGSVNLQTTTINFRYIPYEATF